MKSPLSSSILLNVSFSLLASFSFVTVGCQPVMAEATQSEINRPVRDKWALVIGVSQFANPALNLKYSAKDAQDFADYLKNEAGFAADHVKELINEEATEKRILSLLGNKWLPYAAGPDDLVVIFVSTHGSGAELDVGGQNYLVAYDTDVDDLYTTGIPMQKLAKDIKERVHAERVVIFLDACHSGGANGKGESKGLSRSGVDASELAYGSGQMVIASSKEDQVSWESKNGQNGVFTANLLEALRADGKNTTINKMFETLKDKVQDQVLRERGRLQTPVMESRWQGNELSLAAVPTSPKPGPDLGEKIEKVVKSEKVEKIEKTSTKTETIQKPVERAPEKPQEKLIPQDSAVKAGVLIVPGESVGRVKIGMSRDEVTGLLGRPTVATANTITFMSSDKRYYLALQIADDKVSEIMFSSPAFRTVDGIGMETFDDRTSEFRAAPSQPKVSPNRMFYLMKARGLAFAVRPGSSQPEYGLVFPAQRQAAMTTDKPQAEQGRTGSLKGQGGQTDASVLIVPGRSIAKVKLGMTREAVLKLLGQPTYEELGVLSYWTGDKKYCICIRVQANGVSDVVFSSPAFATASGLSVRNYNVEPYRSELGSPHMAKKRPIPIFTAKEGGLSFLAPFSVWQPLGWLHEKGAEADTLEWLVEVYRLNHPSVKMRDRQ